MKMVQFNYDTKPPSHSDGVEVKQMVVKTDQLYVNIHYIGGTTELFAIALDSFGNSSRRHNIIFK